MLRWLLLALLLGTQPAWSQAFTVEDLRIPMPAAGPAGLEAVLVKPADAGRHPLALLTNGSPRNPADRPGMTARQQYPEALEFARRGFTAVGVLRRGYGSSGGTAESARGPCRSRDYATAGRVAADDLRAAIKVLSARPDVDASRILAVGVSAGGFASVALTADPPPGLVAAISFAGGRGSDAPDSVCGPDQLVAAFANYGRTSRIPMLWIYAENDHFFSPALAARFHAAFTEAGGQAKLIQLGPYGADGHHLFAEWIPVWRPIVDDFLTAHGLELLPAPLPPPNLPDVSPPPGLSANARARFTAYLAAPPHKAFAIGAGGFGSRSGRRDVEDARAEALANCAAHASDCHVVMLDDVPAR